jgi:hypothetical protein
VEALNARHRVPDRQELSRRYLRPAGFTLLLYEHLVVHIYFREHGNTVYIVCNKVLVHSRELLDVYARGVPRQARMHVNTEIGAEVVF